MTPKKDPGPWASLLMWAQKEEDSRRGCPGHGYLGHEAGYDGSSYIHTWGGRPFQGGFWSPAAGWGSQQGLDWVVMNNLELLVFLPPLLPKC